MKHEYRKHEKDLYGPSSEPRIITVPTLNYICLMGTGNPNTPSFSKKIEALFTVAYALKMFPRKGLLIPDYQDYTVYPLEGVWDLSEKGRMEEELNKNELVYTIMIRQPRFMTKDLFEKAKEISMIKNDEISNIQWLVTESKQCVQIMHTGSFESEPESFKRIHEFCELNDLERKSLTHREIYLSDFRKSKPDSLKTILQIEI